LLLLVLAGMLIVYLAQVVKLPIKMPGRHGFELMAILLLSRSASNLHWAATTVGLSAMCTSLLGASAGRDADGGITSALHLLIAGGLVDVAWRFVSPTLWFGALMASVLGLIHVCKPLVRAAVASFTDMQFGSLASGLLYPASTHFMFGFVGAWVALMALRLKDAVGPKS